MVDKFRGSLNQFARLFPENYEQVKKDLEKIEKQRVIAAEVSVRIEGFSVYKELKAAVKEGTPSGQAYAAQLSKIRQRTKAGKLKKNRIPLSMLARLVRYNIIKGRGTNFSMELGFTDTARKSLGMSWKKLIMLHQEGSPAGILYSGSRTELGIQMARIGGKLKKRGDPDAKYFFLRKQIQKFKIPSRPIIDPYWTKRQGKAKENIQSNYERKLAGERI